MKQEYKAIGSYGTLGIEIVLCVLLGTFVGRFLDSKFGTDPYLMALGFFFGLGAAGKAVYRSWKEMQAAAAREEREQGNPAPRFDRFDPKKSPRKEPAKATPDDEHA